MDGYIGQIILFPKNWVPQNWMVCDGSVLDTQKHLPLVAIMGFDIDSPTFSLPIIDSPHSDYVYIICINGTFPSRN
jgi:microcystin-dependent protein